MEIRTLVGGLDKLGPDTDGLEMPDSLGFCESHGVSSVLAVELAKHLPKRSQQRIIEGYTGGTSPCIANDLRRSGLLGGRLWP